MEVEGRGREGIGEEEGVAGKIAVTRPAVAGAARPRPGRFDPDLATSATPASPSEKRHCESGSGTFVLRNDGPLILLSCPLPSPPPAFLPSA